MAFSGQVTKRATCSRAIRIGIWKERQFSRTFINRVGLSYLVVCEETWNTLRARISGWVGDRTVDIDLVVDPKHRWRLNGIEHPTVAYRFGS